MYLISQPERQVAPVSGHEGADQGSGGGDHDASQQRHLSTEPDRKYLTTLDSLANLTKLDKTGTEQPKIDKKRQDHAIIVI